MIVATEALAVLGVRLLPRSALPAGVGVFGVLGFFTGQLAIRGTQHAAVLPAGLRAADGRRNRGRLLGEHRDRGHGAHAAVLVDLRPFVKAYSVLIFKT